MTVVTVPLLSGVLLLYSLSLLSDLLLYSLPSEWFVIILSPF